MFARDGLVSPVSLVKSAVEARLILLVIERLRSPERTTGLPSGRTSSGWLSSALVKRDEFPSLGLRMVVFWNMEGIELTPRSGGSSTSAPISSSATGGILGERDTQAATFATCALCLPSSILSVKEKHKKYRL